MVNGDLAPVSEAAQQGSIDYASLDRRWFVVTEILRQEVLADASMQEVMAGFVGASLSEGLAGQALIQASAKSAHLSAHSADKQLFPFLDAAPVPDSLSQPDPATAFRRAQKYQDPEGISEGQFELVTRRHRYARDIKLLSLAALLQNEQPASSMLADGSIDYRIGTEVRASIAADHANKAASFLNPANWAWRRQLKDRVYRAEIDGQQYILKERKTSRHTDVKKDGHVLSASSRQEFETAQHFAGLGTLSASDNLRLRWEKPVGYVELPDYEFCLFEVEPPLLEGKEETYAAWDDIPQKALEEAIIGAKPAYKEEYEEIRRAAREIYQERGDLFDGWYGRSIPTWLLFGSSLRFKDFARIKAYCLIQEAVKALRTEIVDQGYTNSDRDGFGFRIHKGGNADEQPTLEIVGFDFEYYSYEPEAAKAEQDEWQQKLDSGQVAYTRASRGCRRRIVAAAALAMMQRSGLALPPHSSADS